MSRLSRNKIAAPTGRYRTPRNARGMRQMIISALKITADRMALSRRGQTHDVERIQGRVRAGERRWDDRKILGDIVGNAKRRRATHA